MRLKCLGTCIILSTEKKVIEYQAKGVEDYGNESYSKLVSVATYCRYNVLEKIS